MNLERVTVFDRLREIQGELYQKLADRCDLRPKPANHPLQCFCSHDRSVTGSLPKFSVRNWQIN